MIGVPSKIEWFDVLYPIYYNEIMNFTIPPEWIEFLQLFLLLSVTALTLAIVLAVWALSRIKPIRLPPDADWITAMRMTPLVVVILIDLFDFALDFLSAPISWIILGKLGLSPLRGATLVESLIPGTQAIPTMTLAWIVARLMPRDRT